jgi:GNAT superfamily N-acetyltransferase
VSDRVHIEPLSDDHDRTGFVSGSDSLDRYFQTLASQDVRRRITTCFVAIFRGTEKIAGYYTLSASSVPLNALSPDVIKKLPWYPVIPAALLGRLAVAKSHQGAGLGAILLADAIKRSARAEMGVFSIIVDAKDASAQRFYEHFGFTLLPIEGRRLVLPISAALRRLAGGKS